MMQTMIDFPLERVRVSVYTEVEHQGALAAVEIRRLASHARRAMGQRFRKLNKDIQNVQDHE
jgi:hypothetical protein